MKGIGDKLEWYETMQGPESRETIEVPEYKVMIHGEIIEVCRQKLSLSHLRKQIETARGRRFKGFGRSHKDRVEYDRFLVIADVYRDSQKTHDEVLVVVRCSAVDKDHHDKVTKRFEKLRTRREHGGKSRKRTAGNMRIIRGTRRMSDRDSSDWG